MYDLYIRVDHVLKLGVVGGFLRENVTFLIRTEYFYSKGIDIVADGQCSPFQGSVLRAIVMTHVMHQLPDVNHFYF